MSAPEPLPPTRPSLLPAAIGISVAGAVILVLGFWVSDRSPARNAYPSITILSPVSDTTISGALALDFETGTPIEPLPAGWGAGRYHLHALINGLERMPAPADIQALPNGRYRWTLSGLPDSAVVQLVWALPSHQRLAADASVVRVVRTVRP